MSKHFGTVKSGGGLRGPITLTTSNGNTSSAYVQVSQSAVGRYVQLRRSEARDVALELLRYAIGGETNDGVSTIQNTLLDALKIAVVPAPPTFKERAKEAGYPNIERIIVVSMSDEALRYRVNLSGKSYTCTCPDYAIRSAAVNKPSRRCKHITKVVADIDLIA